MCTAFVYQGADLIYGFNMDINADAFPWEIVAGEDAFYVALRPAADGNALSSFGALPPGYADYTGGVLRLQGVTAKGVLAVQLNNMGCKGAPFEIREDAYPLYGAVDHLLSGRMTVREAEAIAARKRLVNMPTGTLAIPDLAMHSLIADADGHMLLLEPGCGSARFCGRYAVVSNFPLLVLPKDFSDERAGFYGLDRYETVSRTLSEADDGFGVQDGLKLLHAVRQTGRWATRVSFVWSKKENAVYYAVENDFEHVTRHAFAGR